MNREFRGISKETGDFVYGGYGVLGKDTDIEKHIIVVSTLDNHPNTERFYFTDIEVEKETVGLFTGLTDKNGKDIYEGDVIYYQGAKGEIYYCNDTCMFLSKFNITRSSWSFDSMDEDIEIIGNIHENPELLCNEKKE